MSRALSRFRDFSGVRAVCHVLAAMALCASWPGLAIAAEPATPSCTQVVPVDKATRLALRDGRVIDSAEVQLPDNIPRALRKPDITLRYQISLGFCEDDSVQRAILFSRIGGPYEILAGGKPLEPVRHDAESPQAPYNGRIGGVFALGDDDTDVEVTLLTLPNVAGGLIRVAVGPQARVMAGPARVHYRWQQFNLVASAVMGIASVVALAVWLMRRQDRQTLWFALACLMWTGRGQLLQMFGIPIDAFVYEQINPLLIWIIALLVGASTLWSIDGMTRGRSRGLGGLAIVAFAGFALSLVLPQWASPYRLLAFGSAFGILGWMVWLLTARARYMQPAHAFWLALGYCFVMIGATHDFLMIIGVMQAGWWTLLTPGFTLLLLCQMVSVGLYLMHNLRRAERANEELESTIAGKSQELQASYAQRQDLELVHAGNTARASERERIMRDMHDGLGAQLMTALRGIERGALGKEQVAQSLQEGLDELRLLMDSSDNTQPLQTALANWRNRWDARLAATGLSLHWALDDSLENLELPGDTVLQIMRVLQEAGANIVKHAQATEAAVSAGVRDEGSGVQALVLEITDNGSGMPDDEALKPGRGLRNMRQRAQQIGAAIEVLRHDRGLPGTTVRLRLPLASVSS